MKVLLHPHRTPPGGWRYVDPDTGYQYPRTFSFSSLMQHVGSYRAQNKLEPLEPLELLIEDWLCSQPNMQSRCKEVMAPERNLRHYVNGIRAALKIRTSGNSEAFVSQEVAEARASTCVRCIYNKENTKHSRLRRYSDRYVASLVGARRTSLDPSLLTCEICTCPLRPKVHVSQAIIEETLDETERCVLPNGLPGKDGEPLYCWMIVPIQLQPKPQPELADVTDSK